MGTLCDILILWILARDSQLGKWSETVNTDTNHYTSALILCLDLCDILILWILARDSQMGKWSETVNIDTNHYTSALFYVWIYVMFATCIFVEMKYIFGMETSSICWVYIQTVTWSLNETCSSTEQLVSLQISS